MGCQAMTVILSDAASWLGTANQHHRGSSLAVEAFANYNPPFDDSLSRLVTSITRRLLLLDSQPLMGVMQPKQFYFTH